MSDIFLSSARSDAPRVARLASALAANGWSVWFDRDLPPGRPFYEVIKEALLSARCVIVLWSPSSVRSDWARDEAWFAQERNTLVSAILETTRIPLGFKSLPTIDLAAWDGDASAPEFVQLCSAVRRLAGEPSEPPEEPAGAPSSVFLSYSRADGEYVTRLLSFLRQHGLSVWADDQLAYGDRWWKTVVANIRGCRALVVVMSPDSEKSKWVEREILFADDLQKPMFPLLLAGERFPLLVGVQYHDVRTRSLPPQAFLDQLRQVAFA